MRPKKYPSIEGTPLQKKHGQFFLRDATIVETMLSAINLTDMSVFEIGCGDGFLTRAILAHPIARLHVFEIDPAWARKVQSEVQEKRLTMHEGDFLSIPIEQFKEQAPWLVLSNLPYHLTFPILHRIKELGPHVSSGVFMMQEEVAQKIVKSHGKGYGYVSLFFQYYFDWKLLSKVPPNAFYPHPKVFSRLIAFTRKENVTPIANETSFWKFIRWCFAHPRRTLRNNLMQTHLKLELIDQAILEKRAQQLSMIDFLEIWKIVQNYI